MALTTLVNELGKNLVTFLTLPRTRTPLPPVVRALVVLHQIHPLLFNTSLPNPGIHMTGIVISVNNVISPSRQPLFLPLRAIAILPTLAANVAEFCSANTGWLRY
jgi:hypothetical protein